MSANLRIAMLFVMVALVAIMWGMAFVSKRLEHVASGVAALDPVHFESLTLVTAGTGGTFENPWRLGPAVVVGQGGDLVLVDAGRGVAEALRTAEIPAHQPSRIFLTSLLPENTVGLDDLWLTGWLGPRDAPLRVHGPKGTRALVERLRAAHEASRNLTSEAWELPEAGGDLEAVELDDGDEVGVGGLRIRASALEGGPFPAFAYRIAAGDRSVVVASEGFDPEGLVAAARNASALVVGAVFGASIDAAAEADVARLDVLQREARRHLRVEKVGALARRAGVAQVVLTRLRPPPVFDFQYERRVRRDFGGPVSVAADAEQFTP